MSMLSQDTQRRVVGLLSAPLPQWAAIAEAWERGARVEYRFVNDDCREWSNPWTECQREGHSMHLGGRYTCTPCWQAPYLEFRIIGDDAIDHLAAAPATQPVTPRPRTAVTEPPRRTQCRGPAASTTRAPAERKRE